MDMKMTAQSADQGHLEQRWVPVTGARGQVHMEACWITVGAQPATVSHAA